MFLTMFFKTQNIVQTMHLTMLIAHPYQGVECCYEFALYLKLLFSLDLSYEIFQGKVM